MFAGVAATELGDGAGFAGAGVDAGREGAGSAGWNCAPLRRIVGTGPGLPMPRLS